MDLRCLSLCIGMLERVNGVRAHSYCHLKQHLTPLIDLRREFNSRRYIGRAHHPSRQTKRSQPEGEGSHQLGSLLSHCASTFRFTCSSLFRLICCSQRMALNSFQLFLNQLQSPSLADKHKMPVLKIVFDILMVHEGHFLGPSSPNVSSTEYTDSAVLTFYTRGRKSSSSSCMSSRTLNYPRCIHSWSLA